MASRLCPFCMKMTEGDTCHHCGKATNYAGQPMHLPAGYVVSGKHPYVLGAALGQGGFGITYIALNMDTRERVAIKEYYPTYCSTRADGVTVTAYSSQDEVYQKGRERFLDEARTLKSLSDLKSIVNVLDFFKANNTAYLVMEYLEGSSLKEYAAKNGKFPAQTFLNQIKPLMEDIHRMHERGVIHRDIAPDNIILLPDGQLKLIDFGAARSYVGDKSMTVVVKKGFAPVEQYMSKGASASTDVYALAATIYYCITGRVPPDSAERQYDNTSLTAPSALGADLTSGQEKAILHALKIQQKDRTQSMQLFLKGLTSRQPQTDSLQNSGSGHSGKGKVLAIAAAVLAVILIAGFGLRPEKPQEMAEKPEKTAETSAPTETAGEASSWKKNVLMADLTYDSDLSKFWENRESAYDEEITEYFSKRPVFNTNIPRNQIKNVFFLDTVAAAPEGAYDVSAGQDGSVLAWTAEIEKGALDLYIAGEGGINGEEACRSLFYGYTELESIHFDHCFFTETTQNMSQMFNYCTKLKTVDSNCLNTENATTMRYMFGNCENLADLDVSRFDTAKVTDLSYLFLGCSKLTSLDLRSFDTSSAKYMGGLFFNCKKITELDVSGFDTGNVTDLSQMFLNCEQLTKLDLSSFDTSQVTDMSWMFDNCEQLTDLDLSNFDVSKVTDYENFMDEGKTVNGRPWQELFE